MSWLIKLLVFFFGKEIKSFLWMIFLSAPFFFFKLVFNKTLAPWWATIIVALAAKYFWF